MERLLSELKILQKGIKLKQTDTQALIVDLKKEKPELGEVYSKVLQMVRTTGSGPTSNALGKG